MGTSDILKAALEKKNASRNQSNKKNKGDIAKAAGGNQVIVNKPAKKSAGRGR